MSNITVLNPHLYRGLTQLVSAFKGQSCRSVRILRPGQPNVTRVEISPVTGRGSVVLEQEGETYQICCPACNDTRYRLHINYAWGVWDAVNKTHNYFMANCFNEQCHRQVNFAEWLKGSMGYMEISTLQLPQPTAAPPPKVDPAAPGECERLDKLVAREPGHLAVQLLQRRGFNPQLLGKYWGVGYCHSSKFPLAKDRIIFPVLHDGSLVGWQARYVGVDGTGDVSGLWRCAACRQYAKLSTDVKPEVCWSCGSSFVSRVPKYWTMPGMATSEAFLNWDVAKTWPFIVLTEGPMDPIRLGTPEAPDVPGPGVCTFGTALSRWHRKQLLENFHNKYVVLLYDGDAVSKQMDMYNSLVGFYRGVVPIQWSDATQDPGGYPHAGLWEMIFKQAELLGFKLL